MENRTVIRSPEEIAAQLSICETIRRSNEALPAQPLAYVDTYGCQQNEADSERLRGYLAAMGYGFTPDEHLADLILINTCAVREHAEQRVFGNVGALVHIKAKNPRQIICVCGCMAAEPGSAARLKQSFRHVDLVFGPQQLWRFPGLLAQLMRRRGRVFDAGDEPGSVAEGIPAVRQDRVRAWVSVMYGCNNFCSYCIVPYVRGRERSRRPEAILAEVRELVAAGYKEINLLGQNVNSYGKDLDCGVDFADLLRQIQAIPGEFWVRFMTSHPKDAGEKLFAAMGECDKIAPHLHLPFQSGNDRVLRAMNRGYSRAQYLEKIAALREHVPHIVLTSDVIVGFPGETEEEFEDTLSLVRQVRFDALFTFIYSPREGTPAAKLPDPASRAEKQVWFDRLVDAQNEISKELRAADVGRVFRCLIDGPGEDPRNNLAARTPGNRLVHLNGDPALIGTFRDIEITGSTTWALFGKLKED